MAEEDPPPSKAGEASAAEDGTAKDKATKTKEVTLTVRNEDSVSFWRAVKAQYDGGRLCDVRLDCGGGRAVLCHRLVLAAVSARLRAAFAAAEDAREEAERVFTVCLPGLSHRSVKGFVDFLYGILAMTGLDFNVRPEVVDALGADLSALNLPTPPAETVDLTEDTDEEEATPCKANAGVGAPIASGQVSYALVLPGGGGGLAGQAVKMVPIKVGPAPIAKQPEREKSVFPVKKPRILAMPASKKKEAAAKAVAKAKDKDGTGVKRKIEESPAAADTNKKAKKESVDNTEESKVDLVSKVTEEDVRASDTDAGEERENDDDIDIGETKLALPAGDNQSGDKDKEGAAAVGDNGTAAAVKPAQAVLTTSADGQKKVLVIFKPEQQDQLFKMPGGGTAAMAAAAKNVVLQKAAAGTSPSKFKKILPKPSTSKDGAPAVVQIVTQAAAEAKSVPQKQPSPQKKTPQTASAQPNTVLASETRIAAEVDKARKDGPKKYITKKKDPNKKTAKEQIISKRQAVKCEHCQEKFANWGQLKEHSAKAHPNKSMWGHSCEQCGRLFALKKDLQYHEMTDHREAGPWKCQEKGCPASYLAESSLKRHMAKFHGPNARKWNPRDHQTWGKGPKKPKKEVKNPRGPRGPQQRIENRRTIVDEVTGEKTFLCEVCGRRDKHQNLHYDHMKEHMVNKCKHCGEEFQGLTPLRKHMKEKHPLNLPCNYCDKLFASKLLLKNHTLRIHTPDELKPIKCKRCPKRLGTRNDLERHMIIVHEKSRPYKCRYGCGADYKDHGTRNQHEVRQHGCRFNEAQAMVQQLQQEDEARAASTATATATATAKASPAKRRKKAQTAVQQQQAETLAAVQSIQPATTTHHQQQVVYQVQPQQQVVHQGHQQVIQQQILTDGSVVYHYPVQQQQQPQPSTSTGGFTTRSRTYRY